MDTAVTIWSASAMAVASISIGNFLQEETSGASGSRKRFPKCPACLSPNTRVTEIAELQLTHWITFLADLAAVSGREAAALLDVLGAAKAGLS